MLYHLNSWVRPGQPCGALPLQLDAVQLGVVTAPICWDPGKGMENHQENMGKNNGLMMINDV